MTAFIKHRSTFATIASGYVSEWDVPLASASDDSGTILLVGCNGRGNEGDFLILDSRVWLIDTVDVQDGQTTLKVVSPINIFDRTTIYSASLARTTIEAFIVARINADYVTVSDTFYRKPFILASSENKTPWLAPEIDDNNLYCLKSYIETVQRLYNICLDFCVNGDTLCIHVVQKTKGSAQIVFTDGHAQLLTESYSRKAVSKITTIQSETTRQWYLSDSGEIYSSPPQNRPKGEWKVMVLKEKDDPLEKVSAEFAKNKFSHKIEFKSDREYALFDDVLIRLADTLVSSQIAYVGKSSKDNRYHYKSGELAVTLTERIKGVVR